MAKSIPNEKTWIGFLPTDDTWGDIAAYTVGDPTTLNPTAAEVLAATELTKWIIGLNAGVQGASVPTPAFDSLFNRSVPGTSDAQFSLDFYRDSNAAEDDCWDTLPRGTYGFFIVARFGGTGAGRLPIATNVVEVWPVQVTSRTMQNMATNTVQVATVTCAVPEEPNEDAVVGA
jgi:hypothetical protein